MTNKKAPLAWRRWGQFQMDDGSYSAGLACRMQEQSCRDCSFFRAVPLDSGRVRTVCMFHGTKNPVEPCHGFQPGRWEEAWADPTDAPRQSLICHLCQHVEPHTRRAVLLRATVCRLHRPEARSAAPVACPSFRVRRAEEVRHAL